jgi:hypothetical protein
VGSRDGDQVLARVRNEVMREEIAPLLPSLSAATTRPLHGRAQPAAPVARLTIVLQRLLG